nr:hypothetical protein [Actinomycetota bacterium]
MCPGVLAGEIDLATLGLAGLEDLVQDFRAAGAEQLFRLASDSIKDFGGAITGDSPDVQIRSLVPGDVQRTLGLLEDIQQVT